MRCSALLKRFAFKAESTANETDRERSETGRVNLGFGKEGSVSDLFSPKEHQILDR
jgi:hypothetical protein